MRGLVREHVIKRLTRSKGWRRLRCRHLRVHPKCEICGRRLNRQVHHILPVHLFPQHELDPSNLITLCGRHHFHIGHLEDWHYANLPPSRLWRMVREWRLLLERLPDEALIKLGGEE